MIAHHGIGIDCHREAFGDKPDALFDPAPAMLEGLAAVVVDAAKERSSHAALDAMEGAWAAMRCNVGAGLSHAPVSRRPDD
jgi:hypothetical protein